MTPLIITSGIIISTIMLIASKKFRKKVEDISVKRKEMQ
jgi:hypothetical protein